MGVHLQVKRLMSGVPVDSIMTPHIAGRTRLSDWTLSFLVERVIESFTHRLLYNLGARREPSKLVATNQTSLESAGTETRVKKDVGELLAEAGVSEADIETMV